MKSAVLLSSLAIAAAGGWFAATMFAAPATGKEPRFPQLTMDQLSEAQRTVLILFELEGMSGQQIAEITGASASAIWVRLSRARRSL